MNKEENDTDQISDDDLLYRRLHPKSIRRDGAVIYSAYMQRNPIAPDPEVSVNLSRKTTPERTLSEANLPIFGLGVLNVGEVRKLGFTVCYAPSRRNKAHCIIKGIKTEMDCRRLAKITRVLINPP